MRIRAMLFALMLVLAACGDDDANPFQGSGTEATTAPTTGGTTAATTAATGAPTSEAATTAPPTTAAVVTEAGMLEALRQGCEDGDFAMCDVLFQGSDFDSPLEAYANSCGDRVPPTGDYCIDQFGVPIELDQWQNDCGEGDMMACDLLYLFSPIDSLEEAFGDECGGIGEGTNRTCVVSYGFQVDKG